MANEHWRLTVLEKVAEAEEFGRQREAELGTELKLFSMKITRAPIIARRKLGELLKNMTVWAACSAAELLEEKAVNLDRVLVELLGEALEQVEWLALAERIMEDEANSLAQ
jgi:hypothetical protein